MAIHLPTQNWFLHSIRIFAPAAHTPVDGQRSHKIPIHFYLHITRDVIKSVRIQFNWKVNRRLEIFSVRCDMCAVHWSSVMRCRMQRGWMAFNSINSINWWLVFVMRSQDGESFTTESKMDSQTPNLNGIENEKSLFLSATIALKQIVTQLNACFRTFVVS